VKNNKFRFETLKFNDYKSEEASLQLTSNDIEDLFNSELQGIPSSTITKARNSKDSISSVSGNSKFQYFDKFCKLEILFSKDDLSRLAPSLSKNESQQVTVSSANKEEAAAMSKMKKINYKNNTMTLLNLSSSNVVVTAEDNLNTRTHKNINSGNISLDTSQEDKSKIDEDLIREIFPKNLKKELSYLNEKLSNLKFECNRLENLLESERKCNKEQFNMLTMFDRAMSNSKLKELKSDTENFYINVKSLLKGVILFFVLGALLFI